MERAQTEAILPRREVAAQALREERSTRERGR
jgi:hypothetical protein